MLLQLLQRCWPPTKGAHNPKAWVSSEGVWGSRSPSTNECVVVTAPVQGVANLCKTCTCAHPNSASSLPWFLYLPTGSSSVGYCDIMSRLQPHYVDYFGPKYAKKNKQKMPWGRGWWSWHLLTNIIQAFIFKHPFAINISPEVVALLSEFW